MGESEGGIKGRGGYFSEFSRDVHVVAPFEIPEWWRRFVVFDYGLDMFACYFVAVDGEGTAYVYRKKTKQTYYLVLGISNPKKKVT